MSLPALLPVHAKQIPALSSSVGRAGLPFGRKPVLRSSFDDKLRATAPAGSQPLADLALTEQPGKARRAQRDLDRRRDRAAKRTPPRNTRQPPLLLQARIDEDGGGAREQEQDDGVEEEEDDDDLAWWEESQDNMDGLPDAPAAPAAAAPVAAAVDLGRVGRGRGPGGPLKAALKGSAMLRPAVGTPSKLDRKAAHRARGGGSGGGGGGRDLVLRQSASAQC